LTKGFEETPCITPQAGGGGGGQVEANASWVLLSSKCSVTCIELNVNCSSLMSDTTPQVCYNLPCINLDLYCSNNKHLMGSIAACCYCQQVDIIINSVGSTEHYRLWTCLSLYRLLLDRYKTQNTLICLVESTAISTFIVNCSSLMSKE
jgi:hypothetical protein